MPRVKWGGFIAFEIQYSVYQIVLRIEDTKTWTRFLIIYLTRLTSQKLQRSIDENNVEERKLVRCNFNCIIFALLFHSVPHQQMWLLWPLASDNAWDIKLKRLDYLCAKNRVSSFPGHFISIIFISYATYFETEYRIECIFKYRNGLLKENIWEGEVLCSRNHMICMLHTFFVGISKLFLNMNLPERA